MTVSTTPSTVASKLAETCANWRPFNFMPSRGLCHRCGVQWQDTEVGHLYRCPHWTPRETDAALLQRKDEANG